MSEINSALLKIIDSTPIFQSVFPYDTMPAVADLEKFIAYFPGKKMIMSDPTGRPLEKGDGLYEAIHENKIIYSIVPKEIFGFPFRNISMPIYNENDREKIVGALGFAYSIEIQSTLQEMAQSISSSSEELNAVSEEFAASASELADKTTYLSDSSNNMLDSLEKTDEILIFIDNIVDKTKLLGLNALIEAARAGEHGRSFSVVAQEIQKMSDNSVKSVNHIKDLLKTIQNEIKLLNKSIDEIRELSNQQSIASVEISKSTDELMTITESLSEISMKL